MDDRIIGAGIINFDFQTIYPPKFWISNWASDTTYPKGYCYKILSVRNSANARAEIVVLRTYHDGTKEELHRADVSISEVENASSIFVSGLSQRFSLDFEEQDYTHARTLEEFKQLTSEHGWGMQRPKTN